VNDESIFKVKTENEQFLHETNEIKIWSWALVNSVEKFSMQFRTIKHMYELADRKVYDVKTDTCTCLYSKLRIDSA
jgi:hypothetical protein